MHTSTHIGRGRSFSLLLLLPASLSAGTIEVDCDAGDRISDALGRIQTNDTVLVRGTCKENVTIPPEVVGVTLDGGKSAVVQHPGMGPSTGAASHTIYIRGRAIIVTGFTVTGGEDGIHLSGPAHAVIDGNVITDNRGRGIHLDKGSVAQIVNNTVSENAGAGINVSENSYARIGFLIPPSDALGPNFIHDNGRSGIQITFSSGAWIVGNAIFDNMGSGVALDRNSHGDIVGNEISGNREEGIAVSGNSSVNLSNVGTPRREGPNHTPPEKQNSGFGVRCLTGGFVEGPIGGLGGVRGASEFDRTCVRGD